MKYAEKDRFPEIMCPTQTDTLEESGMQIFSQLESMITELYEKPRCVLDVLDQAKLNVPSNSMHNEHLQLSGCFFCVIIFPC